MKRKLSYRILSMLLVLGIILSTVNIDAYAINYGGGSHSAKLDGGGIVLPVAEPDADLPGNPDGTNPDGTNPDGTNPDGTNPDGVELNGNSPEAYVGVDLTNQLEKLGLSLSDWWYLKEDSKQSVEASVHKLAGDNLNLINYAWKRTEVSTERFIRM